MALRLYNQLCTFCRYLLNKYPPPLLPHTFFYGKLQMHLVGLEPKISPSILLLQGEEVPFELNNPPPLIPLKRLLLERVNLLTSHLYKMSKMNLMKQRTKFTFLTRSTFLHLQLQLLQYDLHYAQKQKHSLLPWFMSP